ncbi:MAG: hypothetical protein U0441_13380 [Polyangiaceae bacterium]
MKSVPTSSLMRTTLLYTICRVASLPRLGVVGHLGVVRHVGRRHLGRPRAQHAQHQLCDELEARESLSLLQVSTEERLRPRLHLTGEPGQRRFNAGDGLEPVIHDLG